MILVSRREGALDSPCQAVEKGPSPCQAVEKDPGEVNGLGSRTGWVRARAGTHLLGLKATGWNSPWARDP